ncbi:MAG: CDP-diacylglycerol--glycerol-3-phosphate 3-phosphatidyltransferase [Pseudomonadota bacterium]
MSAYNLPNTLTFIRILLVPVLVIVYYLPVDWSYLAAGVIFAVAGFTDWLDGFVARKYNMGSSLGAFLDPVADKIMVAVSLTILVQAYADLWIAIPAMVIISREIIISALREWMAELGKRGDVAVSYIGKVKTVSQMTAILLLLVLEPDYGIDLVIVAYTMLYMSVAITLYSMLIYLKAAWPHLTSSSDQG